MHWFYMPYGVYTHMYLIDSGLHIPCVGCVCVVVICVNKVLHVVNIHAVCNLSPVGYFHIQ